jgi:hypothetical protein
MYMIAYMNKLLPVCGVFETKEDVEVYTEGRPYYEAVYLEKQPAGMTISRDTDLQERKENTKNYTQR